MKITVTILLVLLTTSLLAQKNYLIVVDSEPKGIYSTNGELVFTEVVEEAAMRRISVNFNSKEKYKVRLNWSIKEYPLEIVFFSFTKDGDFIGRMIVADDGVGKTVRPATNNEMFSVPKNHLLKASNLYLLADGIALGGTTGGIALIEDDPLAATQVITISTVLSYLMRLRGHFHIASAGENPLLYFN